MGWGQRQESRRKCRRDEAAGRQESRKALRPGESRLRGKEILPTKTLPGWRPSSTCCGTAPHRRGRRPGLRPGQKRPSLRHQSQQRQCPAKSLHLPDLTARANVTFWHGQRDGILYRRQFFGYNLETECHWIQAINLADFAVPYGILRVDRLRLYKAPVRLTLGSYGFPDNGTEIFEETCGGAKAIILKGRDATGREKQMAMTIFDGWQELSLMHSTGTNPDSEKSLI